MNDRYDQPQDRRPEPPPGEGREARPTGTPANRDDNALRAVNAVARPRAEAERADPGLLTGDFAPDNRAGFSDDRQGECNETPSQNAPGNESFLAADPADDYGEFAWPEGYRVDPRAMARFVPVAKKLGLDKNGAQELADVYAELDQERARDQARFIDRNNAEWQREIRSHPEFGGRNLARTGGEVAAMMRRYGSPLLMEQIRQMNVQNWPEMFYFLARVSQAVSEDCSPSGSGDSARAMSTAQLLFPGLK